MNNHEIVKALRVIDDAICRSTFCVQGDGGYLLDDLQDASEKCRKIIKELEKKNETVLKENNV